MKPKVSAGMKQCEGAGLECCETCACVHKERSSSWGQDIPVILLDIHGLYGDNKCYQYREHDLSEGIPHVWEKPTRFEYGLRGMLTALKHEYDNYEDIPIIPGTVRHKSYEAGGGWKGAPHIYNSSCSLSCHFVYEDNEDPKGHYKCLLGFGYFKKDAPWYQFAEHNDDAWFRTMYPTVKCPVKKMKDGRRREGRQSELEMFLENPVKAPHVIGKDITEKKDEYSRESSG